MALPFLVLLLLGGDLSKRVERYIPDLSFDLSLPAMQVLIAIVGLMLLRSVMMYFAQNISLKIREGVEISLAQEFVDHMMEPPETDLQERLREKTLGRGPSVMMMGSKEAAIVGVLIAKFFTEIPFILIYIALLIVWFKDEALWMSGPLVLATGIVILSIIRFRKKSLAFLTSFPQAISERRTLWSSFPRKPAEPAAPPSQISDLRTGDTAKQYKSFYKRHFHSLEIATIFSVLLTLTMGVGLYVFYQRVLTGETVLAECIILFALGRFLTGGIAVGISMLTAFSRNFESIRRVLAPLMPVTQADTLAEGTDGVSQGTFSEYDEHDIEIDGSIKHISVLTLNRGTAEMRRNIFAVIDHWNISVETVLTRDYFPKPLPKTRRELQKLGEGFPESAVYSARMHHHRENLHKSWATIFSAMDETPILNICHGIEQVVTARELGFEHVVIIKNGELIESIDLSEGTDAFLDACQSFEQLV